MLVSLVLSVYTGGELLDCIVIVSLILGGMTVLFLQWLCHFTFLPTVHMPTTCKEKGPTLMPPSFRNMNALHHRQTISTVFCSECVVWGSHLRQAGGEGRGQAWEWICE